MLKMIIIVGGVCLLLALAGFCFVILRPLFAGIVHQDSPWRVVMILLLLPLTIPITILFLFSFHAIAMVRHFFVGAGCFIARRTLPVYGEYDDDTLV